MSDETNTVDDDVFAREGVLMIRRGPGANCSSIGSAVEMLFLSAALGATILGAVTAALRPRDDDESRNSETPPARDSDVPEES